MPLLCSSLMKLSSSSHALMSMSFTGAKSRSTRFTFGRTASETLSAVLVWPMLAKKRSPPIRQISSPGNVMPSGWSLISR